MSFGECDPITMSSCSDIGTEKRHYKKRKRIKIHVIGSAACMEGCGVGGGGVLTGNRVVLLCVY
jgi:hypothetical protein